MEDTNVKKPDQAKKGKKRKKDKKPGNPVIRRLRIEFIITMMSIVVLFLVTLFGVQYYTSKRTMENDSKAALSQSLEKSDFPWEWNEGLPNPEDLPGRKDRSDDRSEDRSDDRNSKKNPEYRLSNFREREDRVAILVAFYNTDGTITVGRNNIFFIDTTDVESIVQAALDQEDEIGSISDHNLRYQRKKMNDGTVAVAFADISNEISLLNSELIRSIWISLAVIVVMFVLSIWLSRITTRPAERAWDDQRRFVADASHELKTPLTVIMSNTDMVDRSLRRLVDEAEPEAERTDISLNKLQRNLHRMDNVREESLRMKELIGELLEVARGDVGQHPENFSDVSLSEVADDALLTWEAVFFEAGKTLSGEVEPDIMINGDRVLLRRLIEILLDNALKYSKEKSHVTLSLKREKKSGRRTAHLSVANEGTPMTAEELSHLFDRFYRADSSREKTAGYGLGLSIADGIVEAHKGTIRAEATADGNVFHVIL